jgi:ribose transport system ATP-binding protein
MERLDSTATRAAAAADRPGVLELSEISKGFPGVQALDRVSLTLRRGEVQGLLGENGAGKSTLIKIITGVYRADSGNYRIDGRDANIASPRQAFAHGIGVVHQERSLVPTFTAGENVLLERIVGRAWQRIDRERIHREAQPYMERVGLHIRPSHRVESLSPAQKQLIEIARALSLNTRILLLDEPTASISLNEADALLETIRGLRRQGVSILYVSHKLEEVFAICDSVTVLRDGRNAALTSPIAELDRDQLIARMIGRSQANAPLPTRHPADGIAVLEVSGLHSADSPIPATFSLAKGEILGWYGLVGAGRTELARAVIGADRVSGGTIRVKGTEVQIGSVAAALHRWRIGYVSENRQEEGLFLAHAVDRNVSATVWNRLRRTLGLLDLDAERRTAERYGESLGIKMVSVRQTVGNLSGGNQQKVSVAKWLAANPEILIIDEPTVGIDVKTKYELHQLILQLAENGMSIILISSDMPEMVRLADRILVFRSNRIVADLPNDHDYDAMSPEIMRRIVGASALDAAPPSPAAAKPAATAPVEGRAR